MPDYTTRFSLANQRVLSAGAFRRLGAETVSQDVKRKYAARYVLIERSTAKVAGFHTLSAHSIQLNDVAPDLAK
jgi:hypothetical protein